MRKKNGRLIQMSSQNTWIKLEGGTARVCKAVARFGFSLLLICSNAASLNTFHSVFWVHASHLFRDGRFGARFSIPGFRIVEKLIPGPRDFSGWEIRQKFCHLRLYCTLNHNLWFKFFCMPWWPKLENLIFRSWWNSKLVKTFRSRSFTNFEVWLYIPWIEKKRKTSTIIRL